jgi:hypothetical protein
MSKKTVKLGSFIPLICFWVISDQKAKSIFRNGELNPEPVGALHESDKC